MDWCFEPRELAESHPFKDPLEEEPAVFDFVNLIILPCEKSRLFRPFLLGEFGFSYLNCFGIPTPWKSANVSAILSDVSTGLNRNKPAISLC